MRKRPKRLRARQQILIEPPPIDLHNVERSLNSQGIGLIAGVDESGRGCLAGPVVAAAVVLPSGIRIPNLRDSKELTASQRDALFEEIQARSISVGFGLVGPQEIDRINIFQASLKAMRVAVERLVVQPEFLIVDGPFGIDYHLPQKAIKKGDARCLSIAAASVVAKVTRDRMMYKLERKYPSFSFSVHKGYGTAQHLEEIARHGPSPVHRRTFRGVCKS